MNRHDHDDEAEDDLPLGALTPAQARLAAELGASIERAMASGAVRAEEAAAVLCSISANIITTDPSPRRGEQMVAIFAEALGAEVARVRAVRAEGDARYRAALAAETVGSA